MSTELEKVLKQMGFNTNPTPEEMEDFQKVDPNFAYSDNE